MLALQVSTGKAYVKGYEVEKISPTFKDLNKSRDFETVNSGITQFDLGNSVVVDNVYGTPDITAITDESTAFKTVALYPQTTTTRGSIPLLGTGSNAMLLVNAVYEHLNQLLHQLQLAMLMHNIKHIFLM